MTTPRLSRSTLPLSRARRTLLLSALLLTPAFAMAQQGQGAQQTQAGDPQRITPAQADAPPSPASPAPATTAAPKPAASTGYPIEAQGWGPKQGKTWQARWMDDFTYLRDRSKRKDFYDPIKYIPLNDDGSVYLSLSGELRFRNNTFTHPGMVPTADTQIQWLRRVFGGADLHVGEHFRVYAELAHGQIDGVNEGNPASQHNEAYLQQGFFDITGDINGVEAGFRAGRQLFIDGPTQLQAARDNTNLFRPMNGFRGWLIGDDKRLDVYEFRWPVDGPGGLGDDKIDYGRRFRGVTAGFKLPVGKLYLDPFWYSSRVDEQRWGRTTARDERDFWGVRFYGTYGNLTTESYVSSQRGSYGDRKVRAWSGGTSNRWSLSKEGWKPSLGFHADVASGGGGAFNGGTIKGASFLHSNVLYFDWSSFFGATNLINAAPQFVFQPLPKVNVTTEWEALWRYSENDAVYNGQGAAYARTQLPDGKYIGNLARINVTYAYDDHLSFVWRAEQFTAGDMMKEAGYGDSTFMAAWVNYRF
jgi:hypothetical protein